MAYCASVLGCKCTVVVPETTPEQVREQLRDLGAQVLVHGAVWAEAHSLAQQIHTENADSSVLCHPFDAHAEGNEDLWEGHASLIDEMREDFGNVPPDAIVCTVGGGGLLAGVLTGLQRLGGPWSKVPVVAVETLGADSFHHAAEMGGQTPADLPGGITSLAKTLGATAVCRGVLDLACKHPGGVISTVVSDKQAIDALESVARTERLLVEPSCSAGLSLIYQPDHLKSLIPSFNTNSRIVFIVCGGTGVDFTSLSQWHLLLSSQPSPALPPPIRLGGPGETPPKKKPTLGIYSDDSDAMFVSAGGVVLESPKELSEEGRKLMGDVRVFGDRVGMHVEG